MFYTKVKRNEKLKVKGNHFLIPLNGYIYTRCKDCGEEVWRGVGCE